MHGKDCEDKREYDLRGKEIENKGDANLRMDCESWDKMVWGFVFEKEDKDSEDAEILVVLSRDVTGQGKDNFVALMCQYQVILGTIIIQTFLNGSFWASSRGDRSHLEMLSYNVTGILS